MSTAVTVAVRVRPLSSKEIKEQSQPIVEMKNKTTTIIDPSGKARPHSFAFDHSFWSCDHADPHFVSQVDVFQSLGTAILDQCFAGYNACLFAYGQTGSGKTYSMMGYGDDRGVVPLLCQSLFSRANAKVDVEDGEWAFQATVSYLEIYNEKCRCLLSPNTKAKGDHWRIREHPTTGPYVENLTKIVVHSYGEIEKIMEEGNLTRTVAATAMNNTSSRSHAIFIINFTQKTHHAALNASSEMSSRINLVDLAGSERADRTGATGDTLKEGSNINKSLTTLGKVIHALADGKAKHVPFRDSALTLLLKENLSGNSKTIMLAALSPADSNYEESLSTLRYADRAKQLRTSAVVNEDPSSKKIRELTEEIERLRAIVEQQQQHIPSSPRPKSPAAEQPTTPAASPSDAGSLNSTVREGSAAPAVVYENMTPQEKIEMVKKLLQEEQMSWEDLEQQTQETQVQRAKTFERRGVGISVNQSLPSLVNLNEDPHMNECLVYCLPVGTTQVGSDECIDPAAEPEATIVLGGRGILSQHCLILVAREDAPPGAGADRQCLLTTVVTPLENAHVRVNGKRITEPTALVHGVRIIFGDYQVFRYAEPKGAVAPSHSHASGLSEPKAVSLNSTTNGAADTLAPAPSMVHESYDYHKAMEERFEAERAEWLKNAKVHEESREINASFAGEAAQREKQQSSEEEKAMRVKITELQDKLKEMEQHQRSNLHSMYLTQTSVRGFSPRGLSPAATPPSGPANGDQRGASASPDRRLLDGQTQKQSSLASVAQISGAKAQRLPPRQMLRHKLVLLGHQEVGKTSLRKCFQSDPMFFKKLPDVQSTTGIEAQHKDVKVKDETINLTIQDFAGQEAYHSHSLFITSRTVFLLVWKASAVEQDHLSKGIEQREEERMCEWISEVYAKCPTARIAIVATHLDELRDQSQVAIEAVLKKVASIVASFINRISRKPDGSRDPEALPIIGNFAVSCRNRVVIGAPPHANLQGQKISALLTVLAEGALQQCKSDPVFWGGAVPGRHIKLISEVEEMTRAAGGSKLLLPLSEYVHMAVRVGIESDEELLQVTQLMHCWNIIYMFNQHCITDNAFFFLYPQWLCELAGILFSYAHVINTPLHLRNVIGGLDYGVTAAESADMNLVATGYVRLPLVKVLYRASLTRFLKREPDDHDYETVVKVLNALELTIPTDFDCTDIDVVQQETPSMQSCRGKTFVTRHFVPSLSPYRVPIDLRRVAPLVFNRGVHIRFDFNMLPNELWWRLQFRLYKHHQRIAFQSPRFADEEYLMDLKEAGECHNRWLDGMWLGNGQCRVLVLRQGTYISLYSAEVTTNEGASEGSEVILKDIENELACLLKEYEGCKRRLAVQCPVQDCNGWLEIAALPDEGEVMCTACGNTYPVQYVVVSGTSDYGPKLFTQMLRRECQADLEKALDKHQLSSFCDFLGIRTEAVAKLPSHDTLDVASFALDFMSSLDKVVRFYMLRTETAVMAAGQGDVI
jgi:GTPase SAR1 family protein